MGKEILYSFANNEHGVLVMADTAQRGRSYFCPSCNKEMVYRMGEKVRPHFAHKALSQNCSPETVLHFAFKRLLCERISRSLSARERLSIKWDCESCSGSHDGDLLKRTTHAQEEYSLGACRPDIGLLGKEGNIVAAIEIVVTHSPEQSTIEHYKAKGIPLIVFILKSDTELNRVNEKVLRPDIVDVCLNPKCPSCNKHMPRIKLLIIDGKCWKCNSPMKVGALRGDAGYECELNSSHIALANRNGANIKTRYSKTARDRYAANTCKKCNNFIGGHYLFTEYIAAKEYSREELDAGYYCPNCCNNTDDNYDNKGLN
jgi:ribosomal protein L37AE/L43A